MRFFRYRPHWYMLAFHYGLGVVVTWQLAEDLIVAQWKIYSGDFYPWRQRVDFPGGSELYWLLVVAEVTLLVLFFMRRHVRLVALLLFVVLFLDGLGSFLNHRFLMSLQMLVVSMCPVPAAAKDSGYRDKHLYWNLDVMRFQLSVVYIVTSIHKMNPQFLSGETLLNLYWGLQHHGMRDYLVWVWDVIANPQITQVIAWTTVVSEFSFGVFLNFRRTVGWFLGVAIVFHLIISYLMAYIWIFTAQLFFALIAFLPDRVRDGGTYKLLLAPGSRGPRWFLNALVPGYVDTVEDTSIDRGWLLEIPGGYRVRGRGAWIELMSLSPVTFIFAEAFRAWLFWNPKRQDG